MDNNGDLSKEELLAYNRKLKKAILDAMFRISDTFYVHCIPDANLYLGKRGLIDQEKDDGIILVFGPYATRSLDWDEEFIHCEMQFTQNWENVSIPFVSIFRIFDKNGQVLMQWNTFSSEESSPRADLTDVSAGKKPSSPKGENQTGDRSPTRSSPEADKKGEVIEVDFSARKKQNMNQNKSEEDPKQNGESPDDDPE